MFSFQRRTVSEGGEQTVERRRVAALGVGHDARLDHVHGTGGGGGDEAGKQRHTRGANSTHKTHDTQTLMPHTSCFDFPTTSRTDTHKHSVALLRTNTSRTPHKCTALHRQNQTVQMC